jgi:predicted enzyme related to lactoylglutathione lyase
MINGVVADFVSLTAREYEDAMAFYERGLRWHAELSAARAKPS